MNTSSTSRARQYRQRQREARRERIALYLGHDVQLKLRQLVGEQGQAHFLEKLVTAAIEHEWRALPDQLKDNHQVVKKPTAKEGMRQKAEPAQPLCLGRRRNKVPG